MKLLLIYSTHQLAELMGLTPRQVYNLVKKAGLRWHRRGRHRIIYLAQLKEQMPELWESLVASHEIAQLADQMPIATISDQ
jgi:excisionase family DNA binding protein